MARPKPFQYKTKRKRSGRAELRPRVSTFFARDVAEVIDELVQGVKPGSIQELRVARALVKYEIPFRFQVPIYGGRRVRGGQVVDFLVYIPQEVALQVHGDYWHSGELGADDKLKEAILVQRFRRVVTLWEHDLGSQEAADRAVRREFL